MAFYQIYEKIDTANVLVIGDIMIDHCMRGVCERALPEESVLIVDIKSKETTFGRIGNVIKNLSAFSVNSDILILKEIN